MCKEYKEFLEKDNYIIFNKSLTNTDDEKNIKEVQKFMRSELGSQLFIDFKMKNNK